MSDKEEKQTPPPAVEDKATDDKPEATPEAEGDANADTKEPTKQEVLEQVNQRIAQLEAGDKPSGEHKVIPLGKEGLEAKTTEDAAKAAEAVKPVKVATSKANTDMEGDMDKKEFAKMQSMLGAAKSKDSKVFANIVGKSQELGPGSFDPRATLIFANCKDCSFVVNNLCTKVFVQGCENITLDFKSKIVTHTVEVYKTTGLNATFGCKVGTMQLDMSKSLKFNFTKASLFGSAIWAGCFDLSVNLSNPEHTILTGYDMMQNEYANLNEERSQFKLHLHEGKLINEKVIRLPNGFPTTKREKDAFEARQERNLKILAQNLGFVIPNKKREDKKVGRNDSCPCGSTRKYKKCCGADIHKN